MVRNFNIANGFPCRPIRMGQNKTGPGESTRIATPIASIKGNATVARATPSDTSSECLAASEKRVPRLGTATWRVGTSRERPQAPFETLLLLGHWAEQALSISDTPTLVALCQEKS